MLFHSLLADVLILLLLFDFYSYKEEKRLLSHKKTQELKTRAIHFQPFNGKCATFHVLWSVASF